MYIYINTLQEEFVRAGVLPAYFDFDAHKKLVGMQPGDVPVTYADSEALERDCGFTPKIGIREGLRKFAEWYCNGAQKTGKLCPARCCTLEEIQETLVKLRVID